MAGCVASTGNWSTGRIHTHACTHSHTLKWCVDQEEGGLQPHPPPDLYVHSHTCTCALALWVEIQNPQDQGAVGPEGRFEGTWHVTRNTHAVVCAHTDTHTRTQYDMYGICVQVAIQNHKTRALWDLKVDLKAPGLLLLRSPEGTVHYLGYEVGQNMHTAKHI